MQEKKFKRYTITAALPYANGPIHIGHLAGVYIPADTYARYLRLKGEEVVFICGSDEHGVPITIRARQEGKTPKEVVDHFHNMIKNSFAQLGLSLDIYARTSSPVHYEAAADFFKQLYDKGVLEEATNQQYFDEEQQQFLADRYITGTCPSCGYEEAYGDQCEKCGTSLSPKELINPRSALSGAQPILKETRHWYLPLDQYESWLKQWILEEHKEWKPNVYGQCKSWLDQGLQPRAVTRDLEWGVPVPLEGTEGKVLYVWFDAPIGYISATKEWAAQNNANWKKYWQDEETKLVHFIGKDNIVFHCIIFPVMLKTHGEFILPDNVPANEFMNLEGRKISTSKNWAVWLNEYLEEFPGKEDVLRYMLSVNAPETKDNDFTWKDFQSRNNNELVAIFGNFVNRAVVLTHKYFEGEVPSRGELTAFDQETLKALHEYPDKIGQAIENYHFREAAALVIDLARTGNKYLADTEPWKQISENPERVKTILNISLQITSSLAVVAEPFLPFTAQKLTQMLNVDEKPYWQKAGEKDQLHGGHKINKAALLFEKIENEVVDAQLQKLMDNKAAMEQHNNHQIVPAKKPVSFDEFQAMDIRVGTIVDAEPVKKSKKLLQLKVDTGLDQRTVMSGIAEYYTPDEVKGKQVCILVNLAPRKIMGVESQGMILMAEDQNGKLVFIQPEQITGNGSTVQ